MTTLVTLKKILNNIEEYVCVITLVVMTILNFANVLSRYIFRFSISYTEEVLMILFLWCTMAGTVVAFKKSAHLGLSVITDLLPKVPKIVSIIFSGLASSTMMVLFIYSAIEMIKTEIEFNQVTPVLQIPEVYSTISFPIFCFLAIIRIVELSWQEIKQVKGEL